MSLPRTRTDYSVETLLGALVDQETITERQAAEVRQRERMLRESVTRKNAQGAVARRFGNYSVSPAEVVAAAALTTTNGRALTEDRVMEAVATLAGREYLKLDPLKLNERLITETISRPFARRHACLPVERNEDGTIVFALDNPFDLELLESLRSLSRNKPYDVVISSRSDILRIITDVYGFRSAVKGAEADISAGIDIQNLEQLIRLKAVDDIEANDKPIVNAVEYLLHYAFDQRASDIHLEPKRDESDIRLRIDGVLHTIYRVPRIVHNAMVSRLKSMARMDIAERRRPQAGRIKTERGGAETELRVSSLPVAFGEKLVIRVFDPTKLLQEVQSLGFTAGELQRYERFISQTSGMILVTGPTGSGKTTTLYSTLKKLATPDVNITTIEDPVEMVFEAFNQAQVHPRIDMTFANILRTVLRQDPDIVMVGEIRDPETAQMAVQAALTGHLVFSTLHTNSAPATITRLQDLDVPNFLISSTLVGVVAQRLVRKICDQCRTTSELTEDQAAVLGIQLPPGSDETLPVAYGEGCPHCRGTGLYGRTGIFEVMELDAGIRKLIQDGEPSEAIAREAHANGMSTLREAAIRKLAQGATSFEEVVRVMGEA